MKNIAIIFLSLICIVFLSSFESKGYEEIIEARNYYTGENGIAKDKAKAYRLFADIADKGNPFAMYYLGCCYENGDGVLENHLEANKLFQKAYQELSILASNNDTYAQFMIGLCYANGRGVPASLSDAFKWYKLSAENGNPNSQHNLGCAYEFGEGVEQSKTEALKWYKLSAENGSPNAMNSLGNYHLNNNSPEEAIKYFEMASKHGHPLALYNLGFCYYKGNGVNQSFTEAIKYFKLAAEKGDPASQYVIGGLLFYGENIEKNIKDSYTWLFKAASQGNKDAQVLLQNDIFNKPSVETGEINGYGYVDLGLSVKWATMNLGTNYIEGHGDHYAWGEVTSGHGFWGIYFDAKDMQGKSFKTYNHNGGKTIITPTSGHDAARENMGGSWRLPSKEEMTELLEKCAWIWKHSKYDRGYLVVGPNGNSIFLPAAGMAVGSYWKNKWEGGYYLTNSLGLDKKRSDCSLVLGFYVSPDYSSGPKVYDLYNRISQISIRAVSN